MPSAPHTDETDKTTKVNPVPNPNPQSVRPESFRPDGTPIAVQPTAQNPEGRPTQTEAMLDEPRWFRCLRGVHNDGKRTYEPSDGWFESTVDLVALHGAEKFEEYHAAPVVPPPSKKKTKPEDE